MSHTVQVKTKRSATWNIDTGLSIAGLSGADLGCDRPVGWHPKRQSNGLPRGGTAVLST